MRALLLLFPATPTTPLEARLKAASALLRAAAVMPDRLLVVAEDGAAAEAARSAFPSARIVAARRAALAERVGDGLADLGRLPNSISERLAAALKALVGATPEPDLCVDATDAGLCALMHPRALTLRALPDLFGVVADGESEFSARLAELEARLTDRIEQAESEIEYMRRRAADERALQLRIADLSREALESERAAQKMRLALQEMRSSTSWKVTAPLRLVMQQMARGRFSLPKLPGSGASSAAAATSETSDRKPAKPSAPSLVAVPERIETPAPAPPKRVRARVIAFYLPQFHPIPENDEWWGKGFTEWSNVTKATPQFEGHYQPHLPADLGFYDLRQRSVQARQIELAKAHGVHGFCFYFYWFAGKRLLETPLRNWLDDPSLDLPFCLCWANENWTRRWDGKDSEVLIAQDHSDADDLAFIDHVSAYMRDPRYIRVDGKAMLLVYRPSLLPDAAATMARWRARCRENGVGELHLVCVQSFEVEDPVVYGMDAAVEFPPNLTDTPPITDTLKLRNPDFAGTVYDHRRVVEAARTRAAARYRLYRGVFPSWDNEARRTGRGTVFLHSSPNLFKSYLNDAISDSERRFASESERLVFVNAWNEWAEGAHLEPDQRHGYAWLHAVRDAVAPHEAKPALSSGSEVRQAAGARLTLVVHDAYRHGAQYLALALAERLSRWIALDIVLLGEGPLASDFATFGTVHDLAGRDPEGPEARALAARLKADGAVGAICNSTVSGLFLNTLHEAGLRTVALIHELPRIISSYNLGRHVEAICRAADAVVFPGPMVRDAFPGRPRGEVVVQPQGLYTRNPAARGEARRAARTRLRERLRLPADAEIVLAVAYGDRRKGVDRFIEMAGMLRRRRPQARCVWVGAIEESWREEIESRGAANGVLFVDFQDDTSDVFAGADVYALPSREDPFPTVTLMALECGVPVVGFEGAGDFASLLRDGGAGALAPADDVGAFADEVLRFLGDARLRATAGDKGQALIDARFAFQAYAVDVARLAGAPWPAVSAVVPNYNYARLLPERLGSILAQTVPVRELIVLDDRSTDDSPEVLARYAAEAAVEIRVESNRHNSGSPFLQWRKAAEVAGSDLLWIAEADDLSQPDFLAAAAAPFADAGVVLAYTQSEQIGEKGETLAPDYLDYVEDIHARRWLRPYVQSGDEEIRQFLSVKNTIPNVSACVFRREAIARALAEHGEAVVALRNAGDWLTYARVLEHGKIAYDPRVLNKHRRHKGGVTLSTAGAELMEEIREVQRILAAISPLDEDIVRRQQAYLQELERRFAAEDRAAAF